MQKILFKIYDDFFFAEVFARILRLSKRGWGWIALKPNSRTLSPMIQSGFGGRYPVYLVYDENGSFAIWSLNIYI